MLEQGNKAVDAGRLAGDWQHATGPLRTVRPLSIIAADDADVRVQTATAHRQSRPSLSRRPSLAPLRAPFSRSNLLATGSSFSNGEWVRRGSHVALRWGPVRLGRGVLPSRGERCPPSWPLAVLRAASTRYSGAKAVLVPGSPSACQFA